MVQTCPKCLATVSENLQIHQERKKCQRKYRARRLRKQQTILAAELRIIALELSNSLVPLDTPSIPPEHTAHSLNKVSENKSNAKDTYQAALSEEDEEERPGKFNFIELQTNSDLLLF